MKPFTVNSSAKVGSLNADLLDGLDSAALQKRVTGTCAAGTAVRVVNSNGTVSCQAVGTGGGGWSLTGNAGTSPGANFLGTTDAHDLVVKTNGSARLRVTQNGNVGIGTTTPTAKLEADMTASGAVGMVSTTGPNSNDAVQGNTSGPTSDAIQGTATGSGGFAVFGIATGTGVAGAFSSTSGAAVFAGTIDGRAVSGSNSSTTNPAIVGSNSAAGGTAGSFTADNALNVENNGSFGIGLNATVTGDTDGNGNAADDGNDAIFASSNDTNNDAVISAFTAAGSDALSHEAIETSGFVDVNGDARVTGTLTKGAGAFEIDDPIDPANYYLRHSFVESPDMKNIYDGLVTTDGAGNATVQLPEYFGVLNRDFRYQLTVIGPDFAQAIVSSEIAPGGRSFAIRTDKPNIKVSWQVTGIRQDAYANAHRIVVREKKNGDAAGQYLHPQLFGQPNATPLGRDLAKPASAPSTATATAGADLQALIAKKRSQALKEAAKATATPPPTSGAARPLPSPQPTTD